MGDSKPSDRWLRGASALRRGALIGCASALGLQTIGCCGPDMKLALAAKALDTKMKLSDPQITLHSLNAQPIRQQAALVVPSDPDKFLASSKMRSSRVGPQVISQGTVWDHAELTLPLGQCRSDATIGAVLTEFSRIYYSLVGLLPVAGLNVLEVCVKPTEAMDKFLRKPQVDMKVLTFRSQKVFVGGEVCNPIVYTVADVLLSLAEAINRPGASCLRRI